MNVDKAQRIIQSIAILTAVLVVAVIITVMVLFAKWGGGGNKGGWGSMTGAFALLGFCIVGAPIGFFIGKGVGTLLVINKVKPQERRYLLP